MSQPSNDPVDLTALSTSNLARLLSNAYRREINEEQVRAIAEEGNLLSTADTVNLIHYTAYLADAVSRGGR